MASTKGGGKGGKTAKGRGAKSTAMGMNKKPASRTAKPRTRGAAGGGNG